jgi:hypothetical protein
MPAGVVAPHQVAALNSDWQWEAGVDYLSDDPTGPTAQLATRHESDDMRIYDLWLSGPRDDAKVGGHDATVEDFGDQFAITWEILPGQLAQLMISQVDRATALARAENVRPAGPAEWARMQRDAEPPAGRIDRYGPEPEYSPDHPLRVKLGRFELWAFLSDGDDGGLCHWLGEDHEDRSGGCTSGDTRAEGLPPASPGRYPVAGYGVAPKGTTSITGDVAVKVTFGPTTSRGRLFVFEARGDTMPSTLTFLDDAGKQLGETDVLVV